MIGSNSNSNSVCWSCFCSGLCPPFRIGRHTVTSDHVTKLAFSTFLLAGLLFCAICLADPVAISLAKSGIPGLCSEVERLEANGSLTSACLRRAGFQGVYRCSSCMAVFFAFFAVFHLRLRGRADVRYRCGLQNGFWMAKALVFGLMIVASFGIGNGHYEQIWLVLGVTGALLFIIMQLLLVVDFSHGTNERWMVQYAVTGEKKWLFFLVASTFGLYTLTLMLVALYYALFFPQNGCSFNKLLCGINLGLCIVVSVFSVLPLVRRYQPYSGLLQSAFISFYVMYLTLSAINDNPELSCRPKYIQSSSISSSSINSSSSSSSSRGKQGSYVIQIVSLIFLIATILFTALRNSSHSNMLRLTSLDTDVLSRHINQPKSFVRDDVNNDDHHHHHHHHHHHDNHDNDSDAGKADSELNYSYSYFHFILMLASCYTCMTLTHWFDPTHFFRPSNSTMWVKISAGWLCLLLYVLSLIMPILCTGRRDFAFAV